MMKKPLEMNWCRYLTLELILIYVNLVCVVKLTVVVNCVVYSFCFLILILFKWNQCFFLEYIYIYIIWSNKGWLQNVDTFYLLLFRVEIEQMRICRVPVVYNRNEHFLQQNISCHLKLELNIYIWLC